MPTDPVAVAVAAAKTLAAAWSLTMPEPLDWREFVGAAWERASACPHADGRRYRAAVCGVIDYVRRTTRSRRTGGRTVRSFGHVEVEPGVFAPEDDAIPARPDCRDREAEFDDLLAALPLRDRDREFFRRRFLGGLEVEEIAAQDGVSASELFRRQRLARQLATAGRPRP